jgi:hypothetical protein
LLGALAITGCIRFSSDAPDASHDVPHDASQDALMEREAGTMPDASDGSLEDRDGEGRPTDASTDAPPAPICQRFDPSIRLAVASDLVTALLQDCKIRSAFESLPPVRLQHFEECFAALVGSVLGCMRPDGTRFKYPAYDSNGQFCRDMKTAHAGLSTSDGDFDAFLAAVSLALARNGLTDDEIARAIRTFGAGPTRADIVTRKDAGPTQPCDAGPDSGPDAGAESGPRASAEPSDEAAAEGGIDASKD